MLTKQSKWETEGLLAMRCLVEGEVRLQPERQSHYAIERQHIPKVIAELARTRVKRAVQSNITVRLEEAANKGDERAFMDILQEVRWEERKPEEFVRAIKSAFKVGAPTAARHIYSEALRYHESNPAIQSYAQLFAPPRAELKTLPPNPTLKANREWLKSHRSEYRGQWIAVRNGVLLATATSLDALINQVGDTSNVLLTRA